MMSLEPVEGEQYLMCQQRGTGEQVCIGTYDVHDRAGCKEATEHHHVLGVRGEVKAREYVDRYY